MKIVLIGTVIKDTIYNYDGTKSESFGGLIFAINAMRSVLGRSDTIVPISKVGEDIYDSLIQYLGEDSRVQTNFLIKIPQKNNAVELHYTNPFERTEKSIHPMPPLSYEEISANLDADVLLINMISGWDITLETFKSIRESCHNLIYLDLHSVTLGRKENGIRYHRMVPDSAEWIKLCDILHMNELEFDTINNNRLSAIEYFNDYCQEEGKIVNLTRSIHGSTTLYPEEGQIKAFNAHPSTDIIVNDPTGCGDAFAAGFLNCYLENRDICLAAQQANMIAAIFGHYRGVPDPKMVRKDYYSYMTKEL